MSNTTTIQNNVRLRVFIILVISIVIRATRTLATDSVQKATNILEVNYLLYGAILICSLMPFKAAWGAAGVAAIIAAILGGSVTILGTMATYRCLSSLHSGCIQTAPWSIITLSLSGILVALDLYQSWNIYQILRAPGVPQSALQRIRILFAWALPFGWLVNAILIYKSKWTIAVGLHIVADPTLIVMATTKETALLILIITTTVVSDFAAFFLVNVNIVRTAILAQIALSVAAGAMLFMPGPYIHKEENNKESEPIIEAVVAPANLENQKLRARQTKSSGRINF